MQFRFALVVCGLGFLWWSAVKVCFGGMRFRFALVVCGLGLLWWYAVLVCFGGMRFRFSVKNLQRLHSL